MTEREKKIKFVKNQFIKGNTPTQISDKLGWAEHALMKFLRKNADEFDLVFKRRK